MLNKILIPDTGEKFIRFGNADGKRWIIPQKKMRVALNIYQPGSIKGKIVKNLLPMLHRLPIVCKAIQATEFRCSLQKELKELLCRLFDTTEPEFAIFEGTPSVHRKMTMQVSREREILGYCKLSDSKEIGTLFEKESRLLDTLHKKGLKEIPRAIYYGVMSNGVEIFVQSTVKSNRSRAIHSWSEKQEKFLATLHEESKQTLLFEQSDYYRTLTALQEHTAWLPANVEKETVRRALDYIIEKYRGKEVEYSAYHGDFTPWNMFVEQGELFVFDFEYAALTYPPMLDKFHFLLQTAHFEEHKSEEEILALFNNSSPHESELLVMYLLDVISRFTIREKGNVEGDVLRSFGLWNYMLENILRKI